jgi:arylsulfatase A-like enzyme
LCAATPGRGTSRAAAWREGTALQRPIFAEKIDRDEAEGTVQSKSVRIGDWKWIRRFARASGAGDGVPRLATLTDELYDLHADPFETTNLAADPPTRAPVDRLVAELVRFAARDDHLPELGAVLREHRAQLEAGDAEAVRVLKALGY